MAKPTETSPWQALETAVAHAYREWPVWLVLREHELAAHLAGHVTAQIESPPRSPDPAAPAPDAAKKGNIP